MSHYGDKEIGGGRQEKSRICVAMPLCCEVHFAIGCRVAIQLLQVEIPDCTDAPLIRDCWPSLQGGKSSPKVGHPF